MSNYLIIQEVLKEADRPLSGDQIHMKAKKDNPNLRRPTVSTILNKMLGKGKVNFKKKQAGDIRIKFWKWK